MCRVEWSPLLELYELTAEVKDDNGRTLMKGLSAKVCSLHKLSIHPVVLVHTEALQGAVQAKDSLPIGVLVILDQDQC